MSHLAIQTKYMGPTNNRGSRVKAMGINKMNVTLSWDSSLNSDQNHINAAKALCKKYNFVCTLVTGVTDDLFIHIMTKRNYKKEAKLRGAK